MATEKETQSCQIIREKEAKDFSSAKVTFHKVFTITGFNEQTVHCTTINLAQDFARMKTEDVKIGALPFIDTHHKILTTFPLIPGWFLTARNSGSRNDSVTLTPFFKVSLFHLAFSFTLNCLQMAS